MKAFSPSIARLEERIAPDLFGTIDVTIGLVIGVSGGGCAGCGNGTSATCSASSGYCSSQGTNSGTCHCWRHSH